jgi:hypothetical protein
MCCLRENHYPVIAIEEKQSGLCSELIASGKWRHPHPVIAIAEKQSVPIEKRSGGYPLPSAIVFNV